MANYFIVAVAIALTHGADLHGAPATNALVGTVSASRQFTAYATDQLLPSALCAYAERVKREWLRRLDVADQWRDPILIVVRPREPAETDAPPTWLELLQTESHLKYEIHCLAPLPMDNTGLLATLLEALCAEWSNRLQPTMRGQPYIAPRMPVWLVQGLAASIQGRNDLLLAVTRRSLAAGRPQTAGDLLNAQLLPVDPADRALFQANAWMLTESLLGLPDGAQKMRRFLAELGVRKTAGDAFWAVYRTEFSQEAALEKWWRLQQAARASVAVAENLNAHETAQQLDAILLTKLSATTGQRVVSDETNVAIDQLWRYTDEPWLRDVLQLKIDRLGTLRSQAHPFYQTAIDQYIEAINWLVQRNITRFRRGLTKATSARIGAGKKSQDARAYLDRAERTYAPEELSKVFTGYFDTLDRFQNLDEQRRSPISDYLDKFGQ